MFDALKNKVNKQLQSVTKSLVPPPKESSFIKKGILTPDEFLQAGNKLTAICGSWKWYKAVDPKFETQYLPKDKQFLGIQNICSKQRVKDLVKQTIEIQVIFFNLYFPKIGQYGAEVVESKNTQTIEEEIEELRFYSLYIVYDLFYFTPRLYFGGTDEKGQPLTYEQIKEDINPEYTDKTVTYEHLPYLNTHFATIHPCRHADTIKFFTQQMTENGLEKSSTHPDNSILIFLKFTGSVIPTISFDFISDVLIG